MGSAAWKMLGTGSAVLAGLVATKLVSALWKSSGRDVPEDPTNPEEVNWGEAIAFAAITGLVANAARTAAQRKAAQYYARSSGHLPKPMEGETAR